LHTSSGRFPQRNDTSCVTIVASLMQLQSFFFAVTLTRALVDKVRVIVGHCCVDGLRESGSSFSMTSWVLERRGLSLWSAYPANVFSASIGALESVSIALES
jgi:hypothetical protein